MSATLESPLPTPGLAEVPVAVRSSVPRALVRGEPMFRPCPAMVRQLVPSTRPMVAQVSPAVMMPVELTPAPGNVRYWEAMLFGLASAAKAGVSYQPDPVLIELLGDDSNAKKAKILSLMMGPPRLAPYWLKRWVSRTGLPTTPPAAL